MPSLTVVELGRIQGEPCLCLLSRRFVGLVENVKQLVVHSYSEVALFGCFVTNSKYLSNIQIDGTRVIVGKCIHIYPANLKIVAQNDATKVALVEETRRVLTQYSVERRPRKTQAQQTRLLLPG